MKPMKIVSRFYAQEQQLTSPQIAGVIMVAVLFGAAALLRLSESAADPFTTVNTVDYSHQHYVQSALREKINEILTDARMINLEPYVSQMTEIERAFDALPDPASQEELDKFGALASPVFGRVRAAVRDHWMNRRVKVVAVPLLTVSSPEQPPPATEVAPKAAFVPVAPVTPVATNNP